MHDEQPEIFGKILLARFPIRKGYKFIYWGTLRRCNKIPKASEDHTIEFLPCEAHMLNEHNDTLYMLLNKESCFRCRGYGYPYASMTMLKDGWPMMPNSNLLIESHLTVAEGGLSEITITLLHPTSVNSGKYECKAENDEGQVSYKFTLDVVDK